MSVSVNFSELHRQSVKDSTMVISEIESKAILSCYGIPVPRGALVNNIDEALQAAKELGFPLVAKISTPWLLHKTEIGGVITGISSKEELIGAFTTLTSRMPGLPVNKKSVILLEEQCSGTVELIAGVTNDPIFGPVLMAGIGGIFTNLIDDVAFCLLPAKTDDILKMLKKLKGYPIIEGYRGKGINIDELLSIFTSLSTIACHGAAYIQSIDCNPIIANQTHCIVADASITLFPHVQNYTLETADPDVRYLDTFFSPKNVAVVGASATVNKIGNVIVDTLKNIGFNGSIYPINPNQKEVLGIPAYPSITDIPGSCDVVIIAVDLKLVPDVLDKMHTKGSHNAIIISGGGKELGGEREKLEQEIKTKAAQYAIRIIGPNCIGVFDSFSRFDSFFYHRDRFIRPPQGTISFITQSGTWGVTFMELSHKSGINKMVSYGNRVDVDEGDLISYLASDNSTSVIAAYIEGLANGSGRKFLRAVATAHKSNKPVVLFKTGRTPQAAHASVSHTGAYGGSYKLYRDIMDLAGLISTDSIHECYAASLALALQPAAKGNAVALVSNGAGPMVNALDLFEGKGLTLAALNDVTVTAMRNHFSFFYIVHNPIDITGSATSDDYSYVLSALMNDDAVHIIMPYFVFQNTPLDEAIIEKMAHYNAEKKKPIVCCCTEGAYSSKMKELLITHRVPVYTEVSHWVSAAYALMQWGKIFYKEV